MGVVEGQLGRLNDAVLQFRNAIRLDPNLAAAHLMLGIALRRQADSGGALEQFRLAVKLKPDDPEAQYNLGRELKTAGDTAGAIAAFRRAIELKPDFEQAHYNLALALRTQEMRTAPRRNSMNSRGCMNFARGWRSQSF